ncbi:MAG: methyltransferase domain-containing protein [Anaerolineaceae bacterium]|nr:methyltransferase domain-containing protein [Anaerolineaceae bacterium]
MISLKNFTASVNRNLPWLFYNLKYLGKPPWDTGISPPELYDFIQRHSPGRALDLGCGTGVNLLTLAEAGWQVAGVDFAWIAARRAKRRLKNAGFRGMRIFTGDVTAERNWGKPFDLVLDIGCYHSLSSEFKVRYRKNLEEALAPGGFFLVYGLILNGGNIGIEKSDVADLSRVMVLVKREEGVDRGKSSLWLTFKREGTQAGG